MHLDVSQGTCLNIAVVLFLLCGCSCERIPQSAQPAAVHVAIDDLHRTLIGKTKREVVELLGEPEESVESDFAFPDEVATDEERRRWSEEMYRTATSMYTYRSRNLEVLFNPRDQVIATKPLDQPESQMGSRID